MDLETKINSILGVNVPNGLLESIENRIRNPNVRLVIITGSGAEKNLEEFSDIDLVFLTAQFDPKYESYRLEYFENRLVSFSYSIFQEFSDKLNQIEDARFLKAAIINSQLLYEANEGIYEMLKSKAKQTNSDQFKRISRELMNCQIRGYTEELHKLCNAVIKNDRNYIAFCIISIQLAILNILKNYYNIFLKNENLLFTKLASILEKEEDSQLLHDWKILFGIDKDSILEKGKSGIRIYNNLIKLTYHILNADTQKFMDNTIKLLSNQNKIISDIIST